ncbi:bifunctional riboflavin kinase/FAD synthetase [uncultured Corynebacterium sp.]|uniref:bifunctional riboflavin kinase/FAD synthetase n=1 Tax=uncultured Corynebacterium sp. TaxID=159447 RepID=UPI0025DD3B36|nr:bifunctional riboflavin kinase/FAD synthetase [uncultured Corynebacterium sp.]
MSIWYGLDRIPASVVGEGSAVTIGVFDGLHRGHQQLVTRVIEKARELGVPSVMFTFDPHPTVVFSPERVPALLGTIEQRAELAHALGIDHVVVVGFTPEIASWSPAEYVDHALVELLHAKAVVVGDNFTFGHKAAGTAPMLKDLGAERGIDVDVISLLSDSDATPDSNHDQPGDWVVCSTYVREQLAKGDVTAAARALGRNFSVRGEVTHGAGRGGRALGFPTANLYFQDKYALPADGVYAGYVTILPDQVDREAQAQQPGEPPILVEAGQKVGTMPVGEKLPAAISVGTNPTFGHEPRSVESFILDHEADLYGLDVDVEFVERIRGQETYSDLDELIAAINRDVQATRGALR